MNPALISALRSLTLEPKEVAVSLGLSFPREVGEGPEAVRWGCGREETGGAASRSSFQGRGV